MSKLIVFSGGCYSGKTTFLNEMAIKLRKEGLNVEILNENIRAELDKKKLSIDEIRRHPSEYLELQDYIIRSRIQREKEALLDKTNTIYLEDRGITDCLFYLGHYLDKSHLTKSELKVYYSLYRDAWNHCVENMKDITLIEFRPLASVCEDKVYRPKNIRITAEYEYANIRALNFYFKPSRLVVNLNKDTIDTLIGDIMDFFIK